MLSNPEEHKRLSALHKLRILDTESEEEFDNLVKLAALVFDVPICTITLLDHDRQWFKAKTGLNIDQTARDISFCQHVISSKTPLVVEDAKVDSRFSNNPLVTCNPNIEFYVGVPLITHDQFVIGTLCLMDHKPRHFTESQLQILNLLASQTMKFIVQRLEHLDFVDSTNQILELKQREIELQQKFRMALDASANGVWDVDTKTGEAYFGPKWHQMLGFEPGELPQTFDSWRNLLHPDDAERVIAELQSHVTANHNEYSIEFRMLCKDGTYKWILSTGTIQDYDGDGFPSRMIGTHTDITKIKEKDEIIWRQANFDKLTGLPNRNLFFDRLNEAIKRATRKNLKFNLLYIDLDGFKEINDTYGHAAGDIVLKVFAQNVIRVVRKTDTFSRIGGDEFTIILDESNGKRDINKVTEKIVAAIHRPINFNNKNLMITASIGVAVFPDHALEMDDILRVADESMYVAKKTGKNKIHIFN